jgi:hypothetical protein
VIRRRRMPPRVSLNQRDSTAAYPPATHMHDTPTARSNTKTNNPPPHPINTTLPPKQRRQVDQIIAGKFGMPMGPFRLNDLVGSDIGLHVGKNFVESFGERVRG